MSWAIPPDDATGGGPLPRPGPGSRGLGSDGPDSQSSPAESGFEWRPGRFISWSEIQFEQDVGGGPGGQHVNKTATRVTLVWVPGESAAFSPVELGRITRALGPRLNKGGELRLRSAAERKVSRNREECLTLLARLIRSALVVKKKRVATRPSKASKKRRLDAKRRRSRTKDQRKKPRHDD